MRKIFTYSREDYVMMELGAHDPINLKNRTTLIIPEENLIKYIQDLENEIQD